MSTIEQVHDGLEGVLALSSEIAEPDRDGGVLRYRGVDIVDLVARVPFESVWGLLVDDRPDDPLPALEAGPPPLRTGDTRVDLQAALVALAPAARFAPVVDLAPEAVRAQLARASAATLTYVAESARGGDEPPVPDGVVAQGATAAERFLLRWRGELDPDAAAAIDAYWVCAAEHGLNASTFTARVIASTGADVAAALSGAVGALSGPLHGSAPARVLAMLEAVEARGDARAWVSERLAAGERLMGFGHRIYRGEDPRARVLRELARRLGSPRYELAETLEGVALEALAERHPERVLATNVEFWAAVVLDHARVPQTLMTPLFACARTAGWSAHILEQRTRGRLMRPGARYVGRGPRRLG